MEKKAWQHDRSSILDVISVLQTNEILGLVEGNVSKPVKAKAIRCV